MRQDNPRIRTADQNRQTRRAPLTSVDYASSLNPMDFGRIKGFASVNHTLPEDHADTARTLAHASRTPKVYIAAPVWSHPGFLGKIYPSSTKQRDYLAHYAQQFGAIELNSTFYGVRRDSVARWRSMVPDTFRFCPKVPRAISHELALEHAQGATAEFVDIIRGFGETLGPVWLQLSPAFSPTQLPSLLKFAESWPPDVPLAIELRHEGWFTPGSRAQDTLCEALRHHAQSLIITDSSGRRDVLHQRLCTPCLFLRFAANNLHESDFSRLDHWIERLRRWIDAGLHTAYLMLHQPDEDRTIELAEHVAERLHAECGVDVVSPRRVERFVQRELF